MLLLNWLSALRTRGARRGRGRKRGFLSRGAQWFAGASFSRNAETLEDRRVLSQVSLTSGSLFVTSSGTLSETVTISRNAATITINDPGNPVTASGAGLTQVNANTVTFDASAVTGLFSVNLGNGTDTIAFAAGTSLTAAGGFDLAAETITVGTNTTLTTGGATSNITARGQAITISAGANLLTGGDITLAASATDVRGYFSSLLTPNQKASITLTGSTLQADDIFVTANARDVTGNQVPDLIQDFLGPVRDLIQTATSKPLPTLDGFSAVVNLRGADAFVTVTDATLTASNTGRVTITANAQADSQLDAQAVSSRIGTDSKKVNLGVAVGYSQAKGNAIVDLQSTGNTQGKQTSIMAGGNVLISSDANVVAEARKDAGKPGTHRGQRGLRRKCVCPRDHECQPHVKGQRGAERRHRIGARQHQCAVEWRSGKQAKCSSGLIPRRHVRRHHRAGL